MAGDDTDEAAAVLGERFHVEGAVRKVGAAAVEGFVFRPVGIHVHHDTGEIVCQVRIFPTGVHDASVRDHDRRPVPVLVEGETAQGVRLRIKGDKVGYHIVAMHARNTVVADVGRRHHFPVRQVIGVAKFQIRFIGSDLLVKTTSVRVYFVYLPFPVFVERREEEAVSIPVKLYVRNRDIGFRFVYPAAFDLSAQTREQVDLGIVAFTRVGKERVVVGCRGTHRRAHCLTGFVAQTITGHYELVHIQQRIGQDDLTLQRKYFLRLANHFVDHVTGNPAGEGLLHTGQKCFQAGQFFVKRGSFLSQCSFGVVQIGSYGSRIYPSDLHSQIL